MATTDTRQETEHRGFRQPDETREFPHGRAEILKIGDGEVGRYIFEPGCAGPTTSSRSPERTAARRRTSSTTSAASKD